MEEIPLGNFRSLLCDSLYYNTERLSMEARVVLLWGFAFLMGFRSLLLQDSAIVCNNGSCVFIYVHTHLLACLLAHSLTHSLTHSHFEFSN